MKICGQTDIYTKADKTFSNIFSGQKVDVVVEVDLTSDKAKNDMIQVRIKALTGH